MEQRQAVSGVEALTLANGQLRFSARAVGTGPVVLCLHGFPDTFGTYDLLLPALADAGFRGVAVAMRGYEPQSQPEDGDYHAVRMAEDVSVWIDQLSGGPVHLIGHDWGATIAFAAATRQPEKIASLTMLSVPHPVRFAEAYAGDPAQQARSQYILDFLSPDANEGIIADDCAWLERLWRAWSPEWDISDEDLMAMRQSFQSPGVAAAALSWYRQAFDVSSGAGELTQALLARPVEVPTLGLVGESDGCISTDIFAAAMRSEDFTAGLRVKVIQGAGHFLHLEKSGEIADHIVRWLRHCDAENLDDMA